MIPFVALALFQVQPQLTRLFPHPTGTNGYEEYLRAEDILSLSGDMSSYERAIDRAYSGRIDEDDPLAPKLDYLAALSQEVRAFPEVGPLISAGNQKPVFAPNRQYGPDTTFPEMAGFKSVAKYQAHVAYVDFAEGRSAQGLNCLLDTLTFSRNISHGVLIASLVGVACEAICLREMDSHFNQFSLDDAVTLEHYANAEIAAPPASLDCINAEISMTETQLYDAESKLTASDFSDSDQGKRWMALSREDRDAAVDAVSAKVKSEYEHLAGILSGPESGWFPGIPVPAESDKPAESVPQALLENLGIDGISHSVIRAEGRKRIQFHLLFLQAKIIEFRWLHRRLPKNLFECATFGEIQDHVSGGEFFYRADGQTYTLRSGGIQDTGVLTVGGPPKVESPSPTGGGEP